MTCLIFGEHEDFIKSVLWNYTNVYIYNKSKNTHVYIYIYIYI